ISWRELGETVQEELIRLPDKVRAPLLLCYFEGLTQDEAAARLGWSRRLVKYRLEIGRGRLRSRLTRRGLTLSAALTGSMLASGEAAAGAPPALILATTRAAMLFAAGQPLTGAVTAPVVALTQGALHAMMLSKVVTI